VSGDVTAKAVLAALPTISGFDSGVGPVLDLSKRNAAKGFGGIYNTKRYSIVSQGGQYLMPSTSTFDIEKALQAASAAS
jgi:hypothetical protein